MLQQMSLQNKILCVSFGVFLILYYLLNQNPSAPMKEKPEPPLTTDTYIPPGHVLVPIQVENGEALGAVMGAFAVVDLYSEIDGHSNLIAGKVKLIRAPLNPKQFAVLVSESMSSQIMQVKVPFSVVLQNRNAFKANLEKNILLNEEENRKIASAKLQPRVGAEPERAQKASTEIRKTVQIEYYEKRRL